MRLVPPFSGDGGMTCKVAARRVAAAAGSTRWTGGGGGMDGWMWSMGLSIYTHPYIHFAPQHYDDVGERELSYTSVAYLSFIQRKSPARVYMQPGGY